MTLYLPRLAVALDPLIAEAKRRMRLRRSLLALALLLVGAAVAATLALRPAPEGRGVAAGALPSHVSITSTGEIGALRVGALSVPTPSGFHYLRSPGEVVISDGPGRILPLIDGVLPAYPRRAELAVSRGLSFGPEPPQLKFPLSLDDLKQASGGYSRLWGNAFQFGHQTYFVQVWLGHHAAVADRSAILTALQAIKLR